MPIDPARFSSTVGAAAAFLVLILIVAGALALAPRQQSAPPVPPVAARDVPEPLAPQADPKRVPDARSVAEAAAAADATARSTEQTPIVTLTGCLERSDEAFRLKDAIGDNAPKARSWKTGFLTRRTATIDVIDGANTRLPEHVGQRVSVTGQLVDREIKVRSLQAVSASCKAPRA
jgi:hypothetical protein